MTYDQVLAEQIRTALEDLGASEVREVKMFGGLSFMVDDQLTVSASNQGDLLVRCDAEEVDELLGRPEATWAEMRNKKMSKGWIRVEAEATRDHDQLSFWVTKALSRTKPPPS